MKGIPENKINYDISTCLPGNMNYGDIQTTKSQELCKLCSILVCNLSRINIFITLASDVCEYWQGQFEDN